MHRFENRLIRVLASALMLAALLCASGCSTFNYDWRKAANQPAPANDLLGRWSGTWKSEITGHNNELRCIMTQDTNGIYQARFHAKYKSGWFVVTFGYTVPLQVVKTNDSFKFSGDADLGYLAGGLYHYDGHAGGTNFFSTYSCKYDHGTFQMVRP